MQVVLHHTWETGEDMRGFSLFPEDEMLDLSNLEQREYIYPFHFRLKDLKQVCALYKLSLLESISAEAFLPSHWRISAKAHLTGCEYLLSKIVHSERYQYQLLEINTIVCS